MKFCVIERDRKNWKGRIYSQFFAYIETVIRPRKMHENSIQFLKWLEMTGGEKYRLVSNKKLLHLMAEK